MRVLFFSFVCLLSVLVLASGADRPGAWRVDRLVGSSRLSLDSIRAIMLPVEANARLLAAAEDLQALFAVRYGVRPELVQVGGGSPKSAIYLCVGGVGAWGLEGDAFWVERVGARVFVRGASSNGVLNGVYAICGEVLGARWYWPDDLGLEFVGAPMSKFPESNWHESPVYIQRAMHPMNGDYGRRNRLVRHFQFNHALAKVFTPALYDAEPEIFSEVGGRRKRPKGSAGFDPQPDFTNPRTVEVAAAAALKYFEKYPDRLSFSLSINDNANFDESEATFSKLAPLEYFRGRPNYTDLVFGFMNEVAEQVFEQGGAWSTPSGEPRYLTALAYYWTEQSPSFQLHPRVMPVLTSDRAQWHDPAYRENDKALLRRWEASGAERIATWDYYFGAPYPYPRQFNEWVAESLPFMAEHGVSVFYSQMPSAWGMDGGKGWLATQLLWDSSQDADALLDEYYTHFFGDAAEPIRSFYERAETYRNENEGQADWIKFYLDESGIELFDPDVLEELRASIELAKEAVSADARRRARVEVVSEAFSFTEAYARYHRARVVLVRGALGVFSAEGVVSAELREELDVFLEARAAFDELQSVLMENPMHSRLKSFVKMRQSDPVPFALAALAQLGAVADANELLDEYADVWEVAQTWGGEAAAFHSMLSNVDLAWGDAAPVARDFLGPVLPSVAGWYFRLRASERLSVRASGGALGAASGLHFSGADMFSLRRNIPVISGNAYLLDLTAAYRISLDDRIDLRFTWLDRDGQKLRSSMPFRFPTGDSEGDQRVVIPVRAPNGAYTLRLKIVVSRQYPGDFFELKRVDLGLVAAGR